MSVFSPLTRVLAFAVFALQAAIGLLFVTRPLLADTMPGLFRSWVTPLRGMRTGTGAVDLTLASVFDGGAQREAQAWVAEHVVQRDAIVRSYNQLQWDVFGTSEMAGRSLVRGKDGVLFEQSYILAYCGIQQITDIAALPAFARRLRAAQDWFRRRGKVLVYFMAPTKPEWFPQAIPAAFPCPSARRDQTHARAVAALRAANVDFVDGRAALEARRGDAPVALFPINGIHWNWLGAAIGTEALLDKLRALGLTTLPSLRYRLSVVDREPRFDRDLSDLLNLLWEPAGKPAPDLTAVPAEPAGTLSLAAVNDSFFQHGPVTLLQEGHVFPLQTAFGYLHLQQTRYRFNDAGPVEADDAAILRTLLDADVVVLEEVDTRIGGPFAQRFLDMIEAETARR